MSTGPLLGVLTLLAVPFAFGMYLLADVLFLPEKTGDAEILGTFMIPDSVQHSLLFEGEGTLGEARPVYHSAEWYVEVRFRGVTGRVGVTESAYGGFHAGNRAAVRYRVGRFSRRVEIIGFRP